MKLKQLIGMARKKLKSSKSAPIPISEFEWRIIEEYAYSAWERSDWSNIGVAGAEVALDLSKSMKHLRRCCRGGRPSEAHKEILEVLIRKFNGLLFLLDELLENHEGATALRALNPPTGVTYSEKQTPATSFADAVLRTARVFYLHCLCCTNPFAYKHQAKWVLSDCDCIQNWEQIAKEGYEILEPIDRLKLAAELELAKANSEADFQTTKRERLVSIEEVARIVGLERKSMTPFTKKWGKPFRKGSGRRAALYKLTSIIEILREDFPEVEESGWQKLQELPAPS